MIELKDLVQIMIAVSMPFILWILNGIRKDISAVRQAFDQHQRDDQVVANRVTRLETLARVND